MDDLKPLSDAEITERLKTLPEGWTYADNKISKEFEFSDFMDALGFINQLAKFSEQIDHHPDIHIFYSKVVFDLQRFSAGGKVTKRDFAVAKEIERMFAGRPAMK